ncbi:MAG: AraC family transcriptional regulator [Lachnospiraceae bacterium]|nr:AraC family transcriptional regulator [Lachnospiraceae bacterium]
MYINAAYLHNSRIDFMDKTRPLIVGSCGTYRLEDDPKVPTWRPRGRLDYQLLYIADGKTHFFLDGRDVTVGAGNMVLFRPREEQHYIYYGKDKPEVFWVHFTGSDVRLLLQKYGLSENAHVFFAGSLPEYRRLFERMILDLRKCPPFYEENLALLMHQLLILTGRQLMDRPEKRAMNEFTRAAIENTVSYFDTHYKEPISIEDYASQKGMSVSYFIRSFREFTSLTPRQYLIHLRMASAEDLLTNSTMTVAEVASAVGFDNALYFSRLFKKTTGMSLSRFRAEGQT